MEITIDKVADALYIKLKKGKVSTTKNKGVYLVDYNKKGDVIGFEVLNFSKKVPAQERGSIAVIGGRRLPLPA